VEALARLIPVAPPLPGAPARDTPIEGDSLSPVAPWRVVNLGASAPVELGAFIDTVEAALGQRAERRLLPMQPGDVRATWADTALARALVGETPATPVDEGIARFVDWYVSRYEAIVGG
jgi:UDP-glucuronate 4-epimerase